MRGEMREHGFQVRDAARGGGVAVRAPRLARAPEVEARQRQAGLRQHPAQQEILVAVLGGAEAVARHDHGNGHARGGQVQHPDDGAALDLDGERPGAQAQTRWKSRQAFTLRRYIVSSTGSRLIFATSSATRDAIQGPEVLFSNSPL